jgi:hypothetical protein
VTVARRALAQRWPSGRETPPVYRTEEKIGV